MGDWRERVRARTVCCCCSCVLEAVPVTCSLIVGNLFSAQRVASPSRGPSCLFNCGALFFCTVALFLWQLVSTDAFFRDAIPFSPAPPPAAGGKAAATTAPSALSLSLLESWPLRMLKPLLVNTMGRGLSDEQKASFFYRFGPTEEVRRRVCAFLILVRAWHARRVSDGGRTCVQCIAAA